MKHLLLWAAIAGCLVVPLTVLAWDGFDAATTDLVETVTRNARTVEVVVRTPKGLKRTLVMEGR